MTDAELIQLVDGLIRAMPMRRELVDLRDALLVRLGSPAIHIVPAPAMPATDRTTYMREYMRGYRKRHPTNPFTA